MGRLRNEFIIKLNELLKKHIFIFGTVHGRPVVPMALLVKVRAGIHLNWMPVSACAEYDEIYWSSEDEDGNIEDTTSDGD